MSPAAIGYWHMEAGKLVLGFANPTVQDFNQYPELAIDVLVCAIFIRCVEISPPGKYAVPPDDLLQVLWDWIYCGQPLDGRAAIEPASLWNREVAMTQVRKKGRPIKSRHTAVKALFRREYLNRPWDDVTRLLCRCGQPHDDKQKLKRCQDNIETQVRNLKQVLREYGIAFPPKRTKEILSARRKPDPSQSKPQDLQKIPTLEESRGALRVTSEYAKKHAAIAILLSGDSLPETEMTRGSLADESGAWYMFNPWEPGWIPMWFPDIRTEPIGTRSELQKRRFHWFDKAFKHFAGADLTLQGPLESQRAVVADTLLRMYRAARDEEIPEEEIPKAEMPEEEIPEIDEL